MAGSRGGKRRTGSTKNPAGDGSSATQAAKPTGISKKKARTAAPPTANNAGNQPAAAANTNQTRNRSFTRDVNNHPTLFDLVDPESILRQARAPRRAARRRVNRPPIATPAPVPPAPVAPPAQPQANVQDMAADPAHNAPAGEDQPAGNEPVATSQTAEPQRVTRKSSSAQRREQSDRAAKEAEARKREEAAKQQAADEQAKKDSDAREAAARAEVARQQEAEAAAREKEAREEAKRKEVAREKEAQEKAVQEEKAAREKATRDEAVRQEAARAKASEEQAARKRSAEVKAENAKAAADKVAQENAERAAKEKAAWEEASRATEQATNTTAAQGRSADAKVAEGNSTMDPPSSRQSEETGEKRKREEEEEESEKAAAELEKRDAAGYKRPRTKRSVPDAQAEIDKANKKAKVDEKPSCKAFETGLKLANIKAGSDGRLEFDKPEWDPVKFGEHLSLDSVFMALASVTEAINDTSVQNGQPKLFSLFHPRSLVDYNPLDHPVVLKLQEALVPIRRSPRHLALVVLVPTGQQGTSGEDDRFAMHYYDSNARLRDAFGTTVAESSVRKSILESGWAGTGMQRKMDALVEAQYWEVCDQPAGQDWTSGVHAILNGWVCALALMHNKNALLSKDGFYEKAVELINFVVRGAVSPQTIIDFFDCYEYVLPHPETPSDNVLKRRSWKDTRNFWTYARLDTHIMKLVGRPARLDIEAAMTPRHSVSGSAPSSARGNTPRGVEGAVRLSGVSPSTPNSATTPSSAVAAALRGVEGPAGLPNLEPEQTNVESNIQDATYDGAQPGDTGIAPEVVDDMLEEEEEDGVVEEDDEFETWNGFRQRADTPIIDPEQAARTAAQAQARLQERQKQEYQADIRDTSADPEDDSLFDDKDLDVGEFFGDNGVSNPDGAITQGQHASQPDLPPPVADDEEEDLYTASPPRHPNPPPTASGLHLPGPPPPTPHDPVTNTTIDEFTVPSLEFLNEHRRAAALARERTAHLTNPGFRVPSLSSGSATSSDPPTQPNSGARVPALSSNSANPPTQTNPGFRVPSLSSASATSSAAEDSSTKPSTAREFVITNPRGTFRVPDISSASTDSADVARPTDAEQANAEALSDAWAAGFGGRGRDPDLDAATAEYGSGFRPINESTGAGQTPPGPYGFEGDDEEEPSQGFRSGQSAVEEDDGDEGEEREEDGEYGHGDNGDDEGEEGEEDGDYGHSDNEDDEGEEGEEDGEYGRGDDEDDEGEEGGVDGEYGHGDDEDDEGDPDQEPSQVFDQNEGTFDEEGDDVFREDYIDYDE